MSSSPLAVNRPARPGIRAIVATTAVLVLLVLMAVSTKVVRIGSAASSVPGAFSAADYGHAEFPKVQSAVEARAVEAAVLAAALAKDKDAAASQYGIAAGVGPEIPVKFTGVAGKVDSGVTEVSVEGLPGTTIHVQTGPAIMGTDLRDGTGTIAFGQFTNQIEYQNAGSALNKEMKKQVLSKVDTASLTGKTVSVVGVFQLTDAANWLVTPVAMEIRP